MPNFSKMMSSYPFQLIRGLGPNVAVGGAVGALTAGRGRRTRGAVGGAISGAATYGGVRAFRSMGGFAGMGAMAGRAGTFGRNMMRSGVGGMYGGLLRNKGEMGIAGMMSKVASRMAR